MIRKGTIEDIMKLKLFKSSLIMVHGIGLSSYFVFVFIKIYKTIRSARFFRSIDDNICEDERNTFQSQLPLYHHSKLTASGGSWQVGSGCKTFVH
jgi:hypothetical protein